MGSKTKLSSYCTKRDDNTVNLVTLCKINTRLARPFAEFMGDGLAVILTAEQLYQRHSYTTLIILILCMIILNDLNVNISTTKANTYKPDDELFLFYMCYFD